MSPEDTFRIRTERNPQMCVVHVSGEVDLANAAEFRAAFADVQDPLLVIELSDLRYIDSAGMRALDDVFRQVTQRGGECRVVAPVGTPARTTLRVAGFDEHEILGDIESAQRQASAAALGQEGAEAYGDETG